MILRPKLTEAIVFSGTIGYEYEYEFEIRLTTYCDGPENPVKHVYNEKGIKWYNSFFVSSLLCRLPL